MFCKKEPYTYVSKPRETLTKKYLFIYLLYDNIMLLLTTFQKVIFLPMGTLAFYFCL